MKLILLAAFSISTLSHAALNIKPGLWTIETKMKRDGQEFDPQAKMKEAMAKMSPAQRKQMEAMMAKMGQAKGGSALGAVGLSEKGMQVCITGKTLEREELLNPHQQQDCDVTFPTKTSSKIVSDFKCKNGTNGTAEWNVKDSTHYNGSVKMIDSKGKKSEINYVGTFSSSDCGKVKPIEELAKAVKK